jgi:subfamily B ATP-binding cassette protein MsbA
METGEILIKSSKGTWLEDMKVFFHLLTPHAGIMGLAITISIGLSMVNGAIAWVLKPVMDYIFNNKSEEFLLYLALDIFLLFVLKGVLSYLTTYTMASISSKVVKGLREWIYSRLLIVPMSFYNKNSSGSIVSKTLNDIEQLQRIVALSFKDILVEGSTVLILGFVAIYRQWDLAILSFVVIPMIVYGMYKFGKLIRIKSAKTRRLISNITTILHESIQGIKIIKAFTMEKPMQLRYNTALDDHYKNIMGEVKINELSSFVSEVLGGLGVSIILYYGGKKVVIGAMSIGSFFSFVAALLMVYNPLKRLSRVHNELQQARSVIERLRETAHFEVEKSDGIEMSLQGNIEFKDLTFKYPSTKSNALENINIKINHGEIIALVGRSGAGKSTLADLITRFWEASSGSIFFDDIDLKDISLYSLRKNIGVVTQDVMLFNDTIYANILFGRFEAAKSEVIEAAKAGYAHDFIKGFADGYETIIGERGVKLSGGQRQRISIARAILKNPPILILDEATSSLDTESEQIIQKALEELMEHRTTIVIAHRLSTVQKADRIIVLDNGKILESGTHTELYAKQGLYHKLLNLQLNSFELQSQLTKQIV